MRRIRFSSVARRDVAEARAWYASQATNLDLVFRDELDRLLEQVRERPSSFPAVYAPIRRAVFRRFPYGLFFIERRDDLLVLGVLHHARSPEIWKRRL
ncbi:MAG TPA: type II toxin-antitoxin system RelE/ParE family toxin [Thermoanaerobaculia bacterium]|jgi:plasmid stabilization system protein ParE|nr:type II toxin-antitoxin system RelE/ParE family toxin [Thermoanaerobaculia bacterium]